MALFALIKDSLVFKIVDINSDEEYASYSKEYPNVLDLTGQSTVQVGWVFNGSKLIPPVGYSTVDVIRDTIYVPARQFGRKIQDDFTAENIAMGITQMGKTRAVGEACKNLAFWLDKGSLYEALIEVAAMEASLDPSLAPFLTSARLKIFKNRIHAYLGLPLIP